MSKIFTEQSSFGHARAGELQTSHGVALTPMFMPVGTRATIKSIDSEDIRLIQPQVILANTYHLYLKPGHEHVSKLGGVHEFMRYSGPMLTDSGGFQVFSLGAQLDEAGKQAIKPSVISEEGVQFSSYLDGSKHLFTPEKSIEIQQHLGADIIMAFDECVPDLADEKYTQNSVDRTTRWLHRCIEQWESAGRKSQQGHHQSLFGIVQGAQFSGIRRQALEAILDTSVEGIAFGGETVGYNMAVTVEILDWVRDLLPADMPRYAMGLGRDPQNILDAVQAGYDMFDCVAPTRLARNGTLYVGSPDFSGEKWMWQSPYKNGRMQIGNAAFRDDTQVIEPGCDCHTCSAGYTRAYLHYLFRAGELSYYRLASLHNLRTMVRLTETIRTLILERS